MVVAWIPYKCAMRGGRGERGGGGWASRGTQRGRLEWDALAARPTLLAPPCSWHRKNLAYIYLARVTRNDILDFFNGLSVPLNGTGQYRSKVADSDKVTDSDNVA